MNVDFPEAFGFLPPVSEAPARYRVAYGGRGSGKSWAFARALLLLGGMRPMRILCARETQQSIRESVHRLLSDQIAALGMDGFYRILATSILGKNGTEFNFVGLRQERVHNIKSAEGADLCWVEEAQVVSETSWRILIPTIRREGSEIWITFNPDLDTDATYKRFVIDPPPNAIVRKVNFDDNPYFPSTLREEMERDRRDPDLFSHVWLGNCVSILAGAIYANELRAVDNENRVTRVPYDPTRPVDCYWDLGFDDMTAIWFAQSMPFEYRLVDYLEDSGHTIEHYIKAMQARGYVYGYDYLPWDIGLHAKLMGSGRSIEELLRKAGRKVRIVPKLPSIADGINAARTIFPLCWFDRERCADGLQALRRYRYGERRITDPRTGSSQFIPNREPLHDLSSHGADAFRAFAVMMKPPKPPPPKRTDYRPSAAKSPWV